VLNTVEQIIHPLVLLSSSQSAVRVGPEQSRYPMGWVLDGFDDEHRDCADALGPDFLFCNKNNMVCGPACGNRLSMRWNHSIRRSTGWRAGFIL
jgi:hypothetical protein